MLKALGSWLGLAATQDCSPFLVGDGKGGEAWRTIFFQGGREYRRGVPGLNKVLGTQQGFPGSWPS